MSAPWTYEGYWHAVMGLGDARTVAQDHLLPTGDLLTADAIDNWLDAVSYDAWVEGSDRDDPRPDEWAGFQRRAVEELVAAVAVLATPRAR